ncbi:hypothetical protein MCOR27_011456 [Pyricularia oryzae]|uniref:Uncharacterized protein n=1 Tax=Pyricularia grisea TaxID=148305 RepID=A0ABQ8NPY3_PYRGI|nr:hypothetical protein MCOR01_009849 [Pyricularia oryzae]KAI6299883.1 hypothetical protein MCOR33_004271 [Pyricularia grisea]KAI6251615.1 hypothetical protein MCOR19_011743 [Pyricularia oryzae]KAI6265282.1 hypothetical protein MCOR27_011456 [Pyricularia oryzae]KAI6307636.1 hypothetical protein MCOR30_011663 [Pyricularia oryzae]
MLGAHLPWAWLRHKILAASEIAHELKLDYLQPLFVLFALLDKEFVKTLVSGFVRMVSMEDPVMSALNSQGKTFQVSAFQVKLKGVKKKGEKGEKPFFRRTTA